LARKKAGGVILYRAQSQKNAPEKYKLADKDVLISELLKNETPLRRIAKFSRVDRNALAGFIGLKELAAN